MKLSLRNIAIIFQKELRDITRDRRVLAFMVILPIAVVPVLMLVMGKLTAFGKQKLLEEGSRVAIVGGEGSPKVVKLLEALEKPETFLQAPPEFLAGLLEEAGSSDVAASLPKVVGEDIDATKVRLLRVVELPPPGDREAARRAIEGKELEAAVVIPAGFDEDLEAERQALLSIEYDSSVDKSRIAFGRLSVLLQTFERGVVLARLPKRGIDRSVLDPMKVESSTVASKEQEGRAILALILPYLLILMCFSGAMYPAIDLGAGEKERGTLETLLVSPAERSELVLGKFLVIFVTSLVAALLNVASLAFSMRSGFFSEIGDKLSIGVDPASAAVALVLMLPVAAIFASVLLAISIFAKSFKEAQAYFVPFNFVIIVPAFFSAIPGVELDLTLALIPIVNVSLAIKETLAGTFKWDCLAVILASTAVLAGACVAFCAYWFKREQVLFRS